MPRHLIKELRVIPRFHGQKTRVDLLLGALEDVQRCWTRGWHERFDVPLGNVSAARLFPVRIASERVSACARSAANLFEFAGTAFSFELRRVAQIEKKRRLAVDGAQWLQANVAGGQGHKTAGEDFTPVRDENKSLAVVQTTRSAADFVGGSIRPRLGDSRFPFRDSLLQNKPAIVLRFGALDVETSGFRKSMKPRKHFLEFMRAKQVIEFSAARRHQEENAPKRNSQALHQRDNGIDLADVPAAECSVDLYGKANFICPAHRVEGASERSAHAAKDVMRSGARAIHAYRQACQSSFFQPDYDIPRQQRCCARRQRDPHAHRPRMSDQFEQVRTLDGITARENKHRDSHSGDLIDQAFALFRREFLRVSIRLCGRAAVNTGQVTRLSHFPDSKEGPLVEVDGADLFLGLRVHTSIETRPLKISSDESRSCRILS